MSARSECAGDPTARLADRLVGGDPFVSVTHDFRQSEATGGVVLATADDVDAAARRIVEDLNRG